MQHTQDVMTCLWIDTDGHSRSSPAAAGSTLQLGLFGMSCPTTKALAASESALGVQLLRPTHHTPVR